MSKQQEAMRLALEALEAMNPYPASKEDQRNKAITALRTALEQPEPEPVAWMLGDKFYKVKQCRFFSKNPGEKIPGQIPLYAAPPQRRPLTDEEIQKMRHLIDWTAEWTYITFARAIEAAHGIKD